MEEFYKQLTVEFTRAVDLYKETLGLLEQCEPIVAQILRSHLAAPPGVENDVGGARLSRQPRQIIELLCWWANYGDFETLLPHKIPPVKHFISAWEKSVAKADFEKARTLRYGDSLPHPLNWYVGCKKKPKLNEFLSHYCVGEALSVHTTGHWTSFSDVIVDFFDAVTRSLGLRRIMRDVHGLTDAELTEMSRELSLAVSIEPSPGDTANAVRPLVWYVPKSTRMARPAFRVFTRHVDCVFQAARPQSFLGTAPKRNGDKASLRSEILIAAAQSSWPGGLNFGKTIVGLLDAPDRSIDGVSALKSIAGLLLLATDEEELQPAATNRSNDEKAAFLKEMKESLKVSGAQLRPVRLRPDQAARHIPSRATPKEQGPQHLKLGGLEFVLGQLIRSDATDDVFDSVWLYDLHAWAIDAVSQRSKDISWKAAVKALEQAGCLGARWEETKKAMLSLTPGASVKAVENAFCTLWPSLLRFRSIANEGGDLLGQQKEHIDQLLKDMVHATLRMLEQEEATTHPPRFSDRDKAGDIDLKRWLAEDRWWQDSRTIKVQVRSGAQPKLLEAVDLSGLEIQLPGFDDHNDDDARLLQMPGIFSWSHGNPPPYVRLIHEHMCQPIVVPFAHGSVAPVNFAEALQSLKKAFSVGDGKAAFNDLIKAAIDGDENAVGWLECLHNDCRFQFECFPRIEKHGEKWQPCQPMPEDEHVRWAFDDQLDEKTLVTVTYALSPAESVAIYSKGCQSGSRVLEAADAVQEWCDKVGKNAQGSQLHRATERYWAFGESLGQAVQIAAELLDQIGEFGCIGKATGGGERQPAIRDDGYNRLKSWLDSIGGLVTPGSWSANMGSEVPTEHVGSLPVEFSAAVPVGRVIVNRFGVTAAGFAQPFEGAVSAGASFSGYKEIDDISRRYWAQHAVWAELAIEWSSVPAQSDNKTLLADVLYSIYYKLAIKEDEVDASDWKSAAKLRLITILDQICGWKTFPATDEAELGPGRGQLEERKVIFADGRRASSGTVRVLAKGFEDRRGHMEREAHVERK
jgi:hypothetical protein